MHFPFRRTVFAVAIAVAAATAPLLATQPALAWTGPSYTVTNVPLDWCPGNAAICQDSQRVAVLAAHTAVTMVCWVDSTRYEGQQYPRWFYVKAGSYQGWLKAEWVGNQYPSAPWCWDRTT